MKLSLKANEHIRIKHDSKLAFGVYIGKDGTIHVRAKMANELKPTTTTVVVDDAWVEFVK